MTTLFYSEELVSSLEAFSTQQGEKVVAPDLLKIVDNISKTGLVCYPWNTLKTLLGHLLGQSLKGYVAKIPEKHPALKSEDEESDVEKRSLRFLYALDSFDEAPFTVQRLCELILSPEKVYSTYFKYISALEKMVNISSTLPTLTPQQIQHINQTGVVSPVDDDAPNASSSSQDDYPTSMNVDFNGIQAIFQQSTTQQQQQQQQETSNNNTNNNDDNSNNDSSNTNNETENTNTDSNSNENEPSEPSEPNEKATPMDM